MQKNSIKMFDINFIKLFVKNLAYFIKKVKYVK